MKIRKLTAGDRQPWEALWQESVDGVMTPTVIDHTYAQILDGVIHAFIAEENGEFIGLLHYVVHPVAGCIAPVCYMQDLYVSPGSRRSGVARRLIDHLEVEANKKGYDRIYWLLENSNKGAKEFYKGLAVSLDFGLYMIPVKMKERLNITDANQD